MTSVVFRLSLGTLLSLLLTVGTIAQQPVPERQLAPSHAPNMPVVKLHVSRFKLLTATTGWASTGSELLLTTDAGTSWKKITPPIRNAGRFADVLFLNPMAGWVLYRSDSDDADFIVAMTVNGGGTWTISKIKVSPSYPENGGPELGRSAQLAFTNTSSGYLLFDYQTGSAFSSAGMYATTDGGRTWHATDNNPGFFGSIRGYSNGDLWAVDGYGRQLMVSRNGTGFSDFSLATPPGITSSEGPRYTLPVFVDNTHGYLAVTYEGGPGANSTATLFETEDGGHTWNSDRMVSNLISGVIAPTDIADSNWILAFVPKGASAPSLTKIGPNSHIEAPPSKGEGMSWSLDRCEIDFVAAHQGWANCAGDLLLTNDGGASWSSISPRARNGVITQDPLTPPRSLNAPQSAKRASSAKALTTPSVPYLTALDQHLGFDTKYAPSTAIMEEWWNSSPYYDIGIYLPGSPSGPVQPSLNADWVTTVIGYGWGLIPIWSGPQPPCACSHPTKDNPSKIFPTCNHFAHVFSENAATATNDGITQADHAYNSATLTLGLDGNSIYVDIEHYDPYIFPDTGTSCSAAVQGYVNGWVMEMHSLAASNSAGVYGTVSDAGDYASADNVYIARDDLRATVWHLNHGASLTKADWAIPSLTDGGPSEEWAYQQRIHQYHLDNYETWGGFRYYIDEAIVDAPVIQSSQAKPFNPGASTFASYNETYDTNILLGNNNGTNNSGYTPGEAVGVFSYPVTDPQVRSEDGYIWSSGGSASLLEIGSGTPTNGSEAEGVNNLGQIVGYYFAGDGIAHGYLYSPSSGTYSTFDQGSYGTNLSAINDAGWILGSYFTDASHDQTECVLYKPTGPPADPGNYSVFTFFSPASSGQCNLVALNGIGQFGGSNQEFSAYIEDAEDNVPGNTADTVTSFGNISSLTSVNNNGLFVASSGVYTTSGSLLYIDGSGQSSVSSVNDDGDMAGFYYDPLTYNLLGLVQQIQH